MMRACCIVMALAALGGCAATIEGVSITDEDRRTCQASQDCTVWSVAELRTLVVRAYAAGVARAAREKSGI